MKRQETSSHLSAEATDGSIQKIWHSPDQVSGRISGPKQFFASPANIGIRSTKTVNTHTIACHGGYFGAEHQDWAAPPPKL